MDLIGSPCRRATPKKGSGWDPGRISAPANEGREARDAGQRLARFLAAADLDAEFLLEFHHELHGVDGIKRKTRTDQRRIVLDVLGFDVLKAECFHDEMFEAWDEGISHAGGFSVSKEVPIAADKSSFQQPLETG